MSECPANVRRIKNEPLLHVAKIPDSYASLMLLSGALLALFMTGFWLYCLTDAILTPAADCRGLRKPGWVALIAVTFIAGASAWLIVRRPVRDPARVPALALGSGRLRGRG